MQQSPSWEANRFSTSQEIPHTLRNPKFNYHIHKCLPRVRILSDEVHKTKFFDQLSTDSSENRLLCVSSSLE